MIFSPIPIQGVYLLDIEAGKDDRGLFAYARDGHYPLLGLNGGTE